MRNHVSRRRQLHWEQGGWRRRTFPVDGTWVDLHYRTSVRGCHVRVVLLGTGRVLGEAFFPRVWEDGERVEVVEDSIMAFVTKVTKEAGKASGGAVAGDSAWLGKCPALLEYLTAESFPDGSARQPSTLLVFAEGGLWKGCLNDRENGRTCWGTGQSIKGLFDALEASLCSGKADWRESRQQGGTHARRPAGKG